jgi:hypothetical protein
MAAAVEGLDFAAPHEADASDIAGGMPGHGSDVSAETAALLHNRHVTFDADGIADLRAGRMDPRIATLLTSLSREHRITISAMCSDHPKLTAGGSISNHYYGRAFDIAMVDGRPVGPDNEAAKRMALELGRLDRRIRPTEIGSPWPIAGSAYFTDAAHQNHLHVGFDDPAPRAWHPPETSDPAAPPPVPDDTDGDDDDGQDAGGGDAASSADAGDEEDDDDGGAADEREDGGSGDTEAEADAESDGDGGDDEDSEDLEDEDDDDGENLEDEDDDEDEDEDDDEDDDDDEDHDDDDGDGSAGPSDAWQDPGVGGGDYPGADAGKEEIAAWMAGQARRRGIPPELPVMAALVESGLADLDYGDADSVGFFQMRAGIWDQGDYAGYPDRPELQLDWFLDQASAVKAQRLARGLPIDDPEHYGEWIADIERPAAEYRGRYQLQLEEARALLDQAASPDGRDELQGAEVQRLRVISPEEARRAAGDRGSAR